MASPPFICRMALAYFAHWIYRKTGADCYKFGHTQHKDILERFSSDYDLRYGLFEIKVIARMELPLHMAQTVEEDFKAMFPKNFRLEEHFDPMIDWTGLSGITELVVLDRIRYTQARDAFYCARARHYANIRKWREEKIAERDAAI